MAELVGKLFGQSYVPGKVRINMTPARILVLGFAVVILVGALLLMLPLSTVPGQHTGFLTALFTATSAVCVTGLVVVDTGTHWTFFGQAVILALIQVGGLGFMSMATLFLVLAGKRIGLRERLLIQESLNQLNVAGVVRLVRAVLVFTVLTEVFFAAVLTARWSFDYGWRRAVWLGVFHAVSAFNNAGFDIFGGFRSLTAYVSDPVVTFSITSLIILGGLGFAVVLEIYNLRRTRRLSVHTRLVLRVTAALILVGTVLFALLEWRHVLRDLPWYGKLLASYFQSVTPRTAGFNTVDTGALGDATAFLLIMLMFIGASPGSTGGGIKTTTFGVLGVTVCSLVTGKEDVELMRRRIPPWQVYKALTVFLLSIALVILVSLLLCITEQTRFLVALFETTSAFGTVGLTMGLTPHLSAVGRILIILTMFAGRLGPLTLACALAQRRRRSAVRYPEEKIMVG